MKLISGLAVVALAAATLAQPASAATSTAPTQIAGDWIAGQLTDGVAVGDYGADVGLTIDAGLTMAAFDRSTEAQLVADSIGAYLVTTAEVPYGYVRSDEYDFNPPYAVSEGRYANATAKAAAFTQRVGRDAGTAYDIDLIAQLEVLTDDATGAIADDSIYGNYANTIGQSFAVEALAGADSAEAPLAIDALLTQQCPAGYFRLALGNAQCSDGVDAPSPDVTALAVISLVESGNASAEVEASITDAADWLESVQHADGSVEGDAGTPGSNTNSTGLAGWALGETGRTASAADAAAWTRSMQAADAGACASKAPTGAIAYNADDLAEARAQGITTKRDAWRRATFQAAPVLLWAPASTSPLRITTPTTAPEKSTVNAVVGGLAVGEHACVTLGATAKRVLGTGADLAVPLELPAGSGAYTFSVATLSGTATSTTTVPTPTSPTPTPTAPVTGTPVVGELVATKVERVENNRIRLGVRCDSTVACTGKLKVRTVRKVRLANGATRTLLMAKTAYSVAPGETATVRLKLQRPARKVLGVKRIRVKATQTTRGGDTARTKFWLRRK